MTHAKIPFGEVVVKRHSQVREESQHGVLMFAQPIQEIATGMLFGSPSFSFRGEDAGMNPIALIEQRQETSVPVSDLGWGKPQAATCTCVIGGALHQEQQAFHFDRPPQAHLLREKAQLPQEMHAAQALLAVVAEIRGPGVVNAGSLKVRENAIVVDRLMAARAMDLIMRQGASGGHMHPDAPVAHVQPAFILMDHLCSAQGRFHLFFHRDQEVSRAFDHGCERSLAHRRAQQIAEDFFGPSARQELLGGQIHRQRG